MSLFAWSQSLAALPFLLMSVEASQAQELPHLTLPQNKAAKQSSENAAMSGKMLARISDNIRACSEASSNSDRLRCYDMVAKSTQIAPGAENSASAWVLSPGGAALAASSTTTPKGSPHPGLFIKCRHDQLFAYIEFGENPFPRENHDGSARVRVTFSEQKLDGGTAKFSSIWTSSSAKSAIGLWTTDEAMLFSDHLRRDKTITAKLEPISPPSLSLGQQNKNSDEETSTVGPDHIAISFFTEGSEGALAPILSSCRIRGEKQP